MMYILFFLFLFSFTLFYHLAWVLLFISHFFFFDSLLSYYLQVSCSPKWPHREQTNSSTLQSWKRMAHRVFAGEGKLKKKKKRGVWGAVEKEWASVCFFFPLLCSSTCVPLKKKKHYHLRIYICTCTFMSVFKASREVRKMSKQAILYSTNKCPLGAVHPSHVWTGREIGASFGVKPRVPL